MNFAGPGEHRRTTELQWCAIGSGIMFFLIELAVCVDSLEDCTVDPVSSSTHLQRIFWLLRSSILCLFVICLMNPAW